MNIAFLFPGQGSQSVGMGKDLYEKYEEVKVIYEKVKKITGIDIADISFNNEELLNQTKYTQLAILTMSLGILEILNKNNIEANVSAGLSLGEYAALIYSNTISFNDGVKLVEKRGKYMQELTPSGDWLMAAVLGLDDEKVKMICNKVDGFVEPVNFNCRGQVVISGESEAVKKASELAKEVGAKKVVELNTSGPFHTEKLVKASKELRKELDKIKFKEFDTVVVKNLDAKIYSKNENIREILEKHIISPVKFSKSIETMIGMGANTFIEIGPGKSLSSFVKKADSDIPLTIMNINNCESLEKVLSFVKEEK